LWIGFDCASSTEITSVLNSGVTSERIIYANPCKSSAQILQSKIEKVSMLTFDNAEELKKIKTIYPDAELIIRILADDTRSVMPMSTKYGAHPKIALKLLNLAKELGLNIIGVSFHVGSGCIDATAYVDAVKLAKYIFTEALKIGYNFSILDIGGGFPGTDFEYGNITFAEIANVLGPVIDNLFPNEIRVIAEPGRYFTTSIQTLCTQVFAKRHIDQELLSPEKLTTEQSFYYYINDGIYGSLNCKIWDHQKTMY